LLLSEARGGRDIKGADCKIRIGGVTV
jgi:hypothetical protein